MQNFNLSLFREGLAQQEDPPWANNRKDTYVMHWYAALLYVAQQRGTERAQQVIYLAITYRDEPLLSSFDRWCDRAGKPLDLSGQEVALIKDMAADPDFVYRWAPSSNPPVTAQ